MSDTTETDLIEQLVRTMDEPPPAGQLSSPDAPPASPTLAALDKSRRPPPEVVCATCPNSVWFASPAEVKCYCRVMFLVTWSTAEPNQITLCDGVTMG